MPTSFSAPARQDQDTEWTIRDGGGSSGVAGAWSSSGETVFEAGEPSPSIESSLSHEREVKLLQRRSAEGLDPADSREVGFEGRGSECYSVKAAPTCNSWGGRGKRSSHHDHHRPDQNWGRGGV